jgi:hypothetical protein
MIEASLVRGVRLSIRHLADLTTLDIRVGFLPV